MTLQLLWNDQCRHISILFKAWVKSHSSSLSLTCSLLALSSFWSFFPYNTIRQALIPQNTTGYALEGPLLKGKKGGLLLAHGFIQGSSIRNKSWYSGLAVMISTPGMIKAGLSCDMLCFYFSAVMSRATARPASASPLNLASFWRGTSW